MSHWMTFAGQEMVVLLMLLAFLLFAPIGKRACVARAGLRGAAGRGAAAE